ncbi:VOC family protein [Roseomonas populi]|uniref:VOC family protein n=1 Tax=Roseomonas populi TaxID=3121582 RepID=A0ABT1WYE1_9PROT|nr:VOC family protein [Roseomonas pecuniae]MCR0980863.1 VOC family protein [Roseomonas pecuniae]
MSGIATCLWFDGQAEEAIAFYVAAFRRAGRPAEPGPVLRGGPAGPDGVLLATARLDGHEVQGLNGGAEHRFTPAISLSVACENQAEVDAFWDALGEGGSPMACGWLTDRFGVCWQIFPKRLPELLMSPDREAAARAMQAMMDMVKIEIAPLEAAFAGE